MRSDGALIVRTLDTTEIVQRGSLFWRGDPKVTERLMEPKDVALFDYDVGYYSHDGKDSVAHNELCGPTPIVTAKGDGLRTALLRVQ